LLQPPIVRTGLVPYASATSSQKLPSAKEIPPVTLTNIPHIEPSAFLPYLKQAGSLYEAFQRAKEGDGQPQSRRVRASSKTDQVSGILNQAHTRQGSVSKTQIPETLVASLGSPPERPHPNRKTSGGLSKRGPLTVAPLSTIPSVYFEQDFHLENPRTFDIVSERSEIVRPPPGANGAVTTPGQGGRKALASNAILQEKLSWYMDTVEVHLISSISTASSSFFAALGSLRDLHLEASASVARIKTLREDLASLDRNMALGGLKIVAMRRRQENMRKLGDAVQQLREIVEAVARCEDQVDKGKIEEALRGLVEVEYLIAGERRRPIALNEENTVAQERLVDLRSLKALEGAGNDIAYLRQRIGKSFEARFLEALLSDLRKHVDGTPSNATFQRWDKASNRSRGTHARTPSVYPTYLQTDDSLRTILRTSLEGLARSDSLKPVMTAYREAVWREVKTLIRRHLPSSYDEDNESTMSASTQGGRHMTQQEKSSVLARNLRALEPEDAEDMLKKIYSNVGEALRRLGTQVKVVLDITSSFDSGSATRGVKSPPLSPPAANVDGYMNGAPIGPAGRGSIQQEDIQQTLDMTNLLGQAVDIAQAQITKILKVRAEQSVRLPLPQFLQYFHLNRLFADECEAVSGRGGTALKNVVNIHIKEFVHYAGDTERQRLVQGMDADRWDARDFTDADNQLLCNLIDGSTKDIEAWAKASIIWSDQPAPVNGDQQINGIDTNGTPPKDRIRSATIDEQKFILPESALIVLAGIGQFERLITGIPSMTQEITSSLLEYLKLFNSRSSQLILGAGATRSTNLKNITTKHLALASQALSFVTTLTPYVREFVRRHSSGAGSLMVEFDKVKRLYQEHQSGINDKLVDIMSGRATTHVNAMKKIDWDMPAEPQAVNTYLETLVKETTTLHKVLSKHLPETTVRMIMDPVFSSYREQWGKAFSDADVKTVAGKERCVSVSVRALL
jgi:vacuolar protein sorting-associated protein 54